MSWRCGANNKAALIAALLLSLSLPCAAKPRPVTFKSLDGWTLAGLFQPAAKGRPVVVLIHGVAAGKGEWETFAAELASKGFGTLAFDLRGHGDSLAGPEGKRSYESFQAEDFAAAQGDVTAALAYLKNKGLGPKQIIAIGGSLGANLAARCDAHRAVMLSPGFEYMGVTLPQDWTGRSILAAASRGDSYAYRTGQSLVGKGPLLLWGQSGHGAQLLRDGAFKKALLEWLEGPKKA